VLSAKRAASRLLDELGLEGYLFEIEPRADDEGRWDVRLQWVRGGPSGIWTETSLAIDGASLLASEADRALRARLLGVWRKIVRAEAGNAAHARPVKGSPPGARADGSPVRVAGRSPRSG
jgi:hypothetical protein